jgi:hypothetical protein
MDFIDLNDERKWPWLKRRLHVGDVMAGFDNIGTPYSKTLTMADVRVIKARIQ